MDFGHINFVSSIKRALVVLESRAILDLVGVRILIGAAIGECRVLLQGTRIKGFLFTKRTSMLLEEWAVVCLLCNIVGGNVLIHDKNLIERWNKG